jgi:hypothetical protein
MADTGYSMPVIKKHASSWSEGAVPRLEQIAEELSDKPLKNRVRNPSAGQSSVRNLDSCKANSDAQSTTLFFSGLNRHRPGVMVFKKETKGRFRVYRV